MNFFFFDGIDKVDIYYFFFEYVYLNKFVLFMHLYELHMSLYIGKKKSVENS